MLKHLIQFPVIVLWSFTHLTVLLKIVPDKDCPGGTAYMLQLNNWSLMSIGSCVQLTELDGNRVLRQSADDGIEVRVHSYSQLACTAPGHNCVVTLP